jgi:predicted phosphodiesterase
MRERVGRLMREYDMVIGGHTHIKDNYSHKKSIYLNNGFFPKEKTFLYIEEHVPKFIELI